MKKWAIMKKLIIGIGLFISGALVAQPRSMEEVMSIANQHLPRMVSERRCVASQRIITTTTPVMQPSSFYVVSGKQDGFVVVSADKRMPAVLGQSDKPFVVEDMPPALLWLMERWEQSYQAMIAGEQSSEDAFPVSRIAAEKTVGPLLGKIEYGQYKPYNNLCPGDENFKSVTGCVATAMAQIMRYYKYPRRGTGEFDCASSVQSIHVVLDDITFDWDNILENYSIQESTPRQDSAVAQLMLACGVSVGMNYDTDGSGAFSDKVRPALVNNFYFHTDAKMISMPVVINENLYTDWIWAMVDEFNAGRPLYFAANDIAGGHAFVLDGYKGALEEGNETNVLIHVNWGWNGSSNGWFYLGNLNPGSRPEDAYDSDFEMVYRIYPGEQPEERVNGLDPSRPIFDLSGRKVAYDQLQKGIIYIQNGNVKVCVVK